MSKQWVSRRTVLLGGLAAVAGCVVGSGATDPFTFAAVATTGARDVPDGAGLGEPMWNALPRPVRQHIYQASEVYRVVEIGGVLPYPALAPRPLILVERTAAGEELASAVVLFTESATGQITAGPPAWNLGEVEIIRDRATLTELREGLLDDHQQFGGIEFRGEWCWFVVMRSPGSSHGLDGSTWFASALWFHEHLHWLQPVGFSLPDGWVPSQDRYTYPAADVSFGGFQLLENAVVARRLDTPAAAAEALEVFLAVRDSRRALWPELVNSYEHVETVEGVASYAEGAFLAIAGREAVDPDTGKVYSFPQELPSDPLTWLPFFFGEFEYSTGCAIAQALTALVGARWKDDYVTYSQDDSAPTLVDYVRQYVATPTGEHAARLCEQAARRHNLEGMLSRIRDADFVAQWRALELPEPTRVLQVEKFRLAVVDQYDRPTRFTRLRVVPDPATTVGGVPAVLVTSHDGAVDVGPVIVVRPDLPVGRHVVATVSAIDFRNPGVDVVHVVRD